MIVYNTNDIVKKAKQLADLVNSDFISYNENVSLLNDAYTQLYQKSIDIGDNLYVKQLRLEPSLADNSIGVNNVQVFCLPCDFYQLKNITESGDITRTQLPRRTKNSSNLTRCYEIKNNNLYVYGLAYRDIELEYYPIPETLTLKAEEVPLKDLAGTPVALYRNHLISVLGTDIYHYDLNRSELVESYTLGEKNTVIYAIAGDNGIVVKRSDSSGGSAIEYLTQFDYGSKEPVLDVAITDKCVIRAIDEEGNFVSIEDSTTDDKMRKSIFKLIYPEVSFIEYVSSNDLPNIITKEIGDTISLVTEVPEISKDLKLLYCEDDILYFIDVKKSELIAINSNTQERIDLSISSSIKVIDEANKDFSTGYGRLIKLANRYYIRSCFDNTELDYPNNFYFTFLAYKLAIAYKVKQSADPSLLAMQLKEVEDAYYDSLARDTNNCIRISNAYMN